LTSTRFPLTNDGKVYLKKDNGLESIQSFVITNSTTTGSLDLIGDQTISGSLFVSGNLVDVKSIKFDTSDSITLNEGELGWNSDDGTLNLGLNGGEVTLQVGQEIHYRVRNQSGNLIENGSVVYTTGVADDKLLIDKFVADGTIEHEKVLGVTTEDIADNANGYVTWFGKVRGIDTTAFNAGDELFAHPTSAGELTTTEPSPPSQSYFIGFVTEDDVSGSIQLKPHYHRNASEILFDASGSNLQSSNVGSALKELDANKASIDALSSNIYFYSTNATSSVDNSYFRLVTDQDDPDYPDTAVNIPTGTISGSNQFIAQLISDDNIISGNPGTISITTFGNVRRVDGGVFSSADFYFEVYKRSGSLEELIGTSNTTTEVNETSYEQFSATAVITPVSYSLDDRVVLKYYGNLVGTIGADPSFEFQFGGNTPVTTLFPVPVSVIPSTVTAEGVPTDTSNFNGKLSGADDDIQRALDTLDDHTHTLQEISDAGNTTTNQLNLGGLEVDGGTLYVDTTNNRVGINTTSPSQELTVDGDISGSGNLNIDGVISGDGSGLTNIPLASGARSGSFSGSFEGDGSGLTGILSSSFSSTSSYVDFSDIDNKPTLVSSSAQIASDISGSFTSVSQSFASDRLKNTTDTLDGDLTVTGRITAQEFHTEFVTSSVIFESGSTKFGDSADDIHTFTGSVNINGTLSADELDLGTTGIPEITSATNLILSASNAIIMSSSAGVRVENGVTGSFTGSFVGDGSGLTSVEGIVLHNVTVENRGQGNKFIIDNQYAPQLSLVPGKTYKFNQSDPSNLTHPLAFRLPDDTSYTDGVTTVGTPGQAGAYTELTVGYNTSGSLKYYCTVHGNGMGNFVEVLNEFENPQVRYDVTVENRGQGNKFIFDESDWSNIYVVPGVNVSAGAY
jgi:hypothetical protein